MVLIVGGGRVGWGGWCGLGWECGGGGWVIVGEGNLVGIEVGEEVVDVYAGGGWISRVV